MIERVDAIVALANDSFARNRLNEETAQRMSAAVDLVRVGVAPHLVVAGRYSFMRQPPPECPLAELMKDYAINAGIPGAQIEVEAKSLDTIGDALFTKTDITEPNSWRNLMVVTSNYHLKRSHRIFEHVMGPDYNVMCVAAGESSQKYRRIYETAGNIVMKAVLNGTEPGDTEAIRKRLLGIIPGYCELPISTRLRNFSTALLAR